MNALLLGPGVRRFLREEGKKLIFLTALCLALVTVLTRPDTNQIGSKILDTKFTSSGSLLLPARARVTLSNFVIVKGRNDLEYWLANEEMFQQLLQRKQVYKRVEDLLSKRHPELLTHYHSVLIAPSYAAYRISEDDEEEPSADYAVAAESDMQATRELSQDRLRRNANRVVVQAQADTPENSQRLAQVALAVMQDVLAETATRRVKQEMNSVEGYIKLSERRIRKTENALNLLSKSALELEAEATNRLAVLHTRIASLQSDVVRLRRQITIAESDARLVSLLSPNVYQKALQAAERERLAAAAVYQPDSDAFQDVLEHVNRIKQLTTQQEQAISLVATARLRAEMEAKRRLEAETREECQRWRQLTMPPAVKKTFMLKSKELTLWQTELLGWERKLLQIRIEHNLCRSEGTSVILLSPLPGKRWSMHGPNFMDKYQKTLKVLPIAPVLALALTLFYWILKESYRVPQRAQYYLDAPVLADLGFFSQPKPDKSRGLIRINRRSRHDL